MPDIRAIVQAIRGPRDPGFNKCADAFDSVQAQLNKLASDLSTLTTTVAGLSTSTSPAIITIPADGDATATINLDGTVDIDLDQGLNWNLTITRDVTIKVPIRSGGGAVSKPGRFCIKIIQAAPTDPGYHKVIWNGIFITGGLDVDPNPGAATVFNFWYTAGNAWQIRSYLSGI